MSWSRWLSQEVGLDKVPRCVKRRARCDAEHIPLNDRSAHREAPSEVSHEVLRWQQNCDLIISRTKASIEMLMIKQQTEDRAFELHQKIAGRVRARQLEKVSRFSREAIGERDSGLFQEGDAILIPGKY